MLFELLKMPVLGMISDTVARWKRGAAMRLTQIIQAALLVTAAGPVSAQDWATVKFIEDGFRANFPGEPTIESITYETEFDMQLPGRVYQAADALGDYSTTVVDYRGVQQLHDERSNRCRAANGANQLDGDSCQNNFVMEIAGAIDHAAAEFLSREGVKVTQYGIYHIDRVLGRHMQLTNSDGSRTYAGIHQHLGRLYIHQAIVPAGMPEPILFMQSLAWVNAEGLAIRYLGLYSEGYGEWQFPRSDRPAFRVRDMDNSLERPATPRRPPPPRRGDP
jgi:hypothetical protein